MNISEIKSKLQALQTQKNASSSGKSSKDIFFRPSVGKEVIRILPSKFNKSNPFSELYFHYGIHKFPMFSPINTGDKDPIVEFVKQLRETNDKENWRLARKLEPKMRVFVPVIVRGKEDEGVRLWGFGKEIYMELLSMVEDEDIGDYTDILTGRDLTLTTVDSTQTGTGYSKTTLRPRTAQTPLAEENETVKILLENQPDPIESFTKMEFDRMKEILHEYLAPDEDTSESKIPDVAFETPSSPTNKFSLEKQGKPKESKEDKFDSLFNGKNDDLPF